MLDNPLIIRSSTGVMPEYEGLPIFREMFGRDAAEGDDHFPLVGATSPTPRLLRLTGEASIPGDGAR